MGASRREWIGLALALATYALVRALVLHTNFDEFAMPQFELFPMGTIPLLQGADGGLPVSRVYDNSAGQLLTGWLATPFYALFGETYLALKLVPLTLGALALVFLWLVVRESAGTRAANVAGFLFALAPSTLVKYSTFASGNHFETLAFNALALWATLRLHRSGVRHIESAHAGNFVTPCKVGCNALTLRCVTAIDDHMRTGACQRLRKRETNALRRACDERAFTGQIE